MKDETVLKFLDSSNNLMALLIKDGHFSQGIEFLTDSDSYMQVAFMSHPEGHVIKPHYHNQVSRTIDYTSEALIIKDGVLDVFLYENLMIKHEFKIRKGDILVLFSGGHGFKCVGKVSMVEIKQGPFVGLEDKTRFNGGLE